MSSPDGMFDGVKPTFSGDQGTTIKQLINSHMIRRQITCKISPEGRDKSLLLVANDKGRITSLQLSSLYKALDSNKQRPTLTVSNSCSQQVTYTRVVLIAEEASSDVTFIKIISHIYQHHSGLK